MSAHARTPGARGVGHRPRLHGRELKLLPGNGQAAEIFPVEGLGRRRSLPCRSSDSALGHGLRPRRARRADRHRFALSDRDFNRALGRAEAAAVWTLVGRDRDRSARRGIEDAHTRLGGAHRRTAFTTAFHERVVRPKRDELDVHRDMVGRPQSDLLKELPADRLRLLCEQPAFGRR